MGDVVSLVEKAAETIEIEEAEKLAKKIQKGKFDLDDMRSQLRQMQKMGGLSSLMGMLPGMSKPRWASSRRPSWRRHGQAADRHDQLHDPAGKAPARDHQGLAQAAHRERSGSTVQELNRLLKQHGEAAKMMKRVNKMGKKGLIPGGMAGLLGGGAGGDAGAGLPGPGASGGLPGLPPGGGLPGPGRPGGGMPGLLPPGFPGGKKGFKG